MRKPFVVGLLLAVLLLGGCGDPESGPPREPAGLPKASATTHQRAPASPSSSPSAAPVKAPTVLYLGDSLAMEAQKVLGQELRKQLRATYTSAPYSGTTPCDYLEGTGERSLVPDADKAAALVRKVRPDFVVLQFWGNAWGYTWCMDGITHDASPETYFRRYAADLKRLTDQIAAAGDARIVWVLQGPDPITPDRVRRVNTLYEERAAASGALVADAGRTVSAAGARNTWVQHLPCTAYERAHPDYCTEPASDRTALHRDDDYLHFCLAPTTATPKPCPARSPGILRIAREITRVIGERL
ncbi:MULTISPECIES: SGNH/GDSL hydrolase family protein [unclassified Streptomyces]|uniref:SGNH/GDSL hydrolase family protein n=1 Tax=unclassified Streptomyces TaxID=2593676 RepID=UPI001661A918|nr:MULTISPECIES: SGNH/GDSL hydrolase family protein [unclassified Streptomyces]MBD0842930.1 SGNH/GDSL hydrolase family protein [Streptomyces sp. TRM68416]